MATPGSMREAFAVLNTMNDEGIFEKYAVGGAVASSIHLEPTTTANVDIFVTLKPCPSKLILSLESVYDYLLRKGANQDGQYIVYAGWPMQFLSSGTSPLVAEAVDNAQEFEADNLSVWMIAPEYLGAIALEVGRSKDKVRLNAPMKSGILDLREFKGIAHRHRLEKKDAEWLKWQIAV